MALDHAFSYHFWRNPDTRPNWPGTWNSLEQTFLTTWRACGIVVAIPEDRRTRYEIADPHITRALESLMDAVLMVDESQPCVDDCCAPAPAKEKA